MGEGVVERTFPKTPDVDLVVTKLKSIEHLRARKVVVARGVVDDRQCRARLDAMTASITAESIEVVGDDELEAELSRLGPRAQLERGGLRGRSREKQVVAFARWRSEEVFPGYSWQELRSSRRELHRNGVLCQTGVEIQSALGCPFDCAYCPYTGFVCMRLDVEGFVDRVAKMALARPSQALFKLNNRTDTLALEPEYGLAPALVKRFAELDGKHLLLYAKGDAVDGLLGLDHRGKTVASFTLTPAPIAAMLEPGAPPPSARIEAMRRLARAGYPVRARLSPIVPVDGWQAQYRDLVTELFAAVRPEMVTLWTLSMVELDELSQIVPLEALDEEALALSRASEESMRGVKGAPFPPALRVAIYREVASLVHDADPSTVVALCLETQEVWKALADVLTPRRGGRFLCNCGPRATPVAVCEGAVHDAERARSMCG